MKATGIIFLVAGTLMAGYGIYTAQFANAPVSVANTAVKVGFAGGGLMALGVIGIIISKQK